MLPAPGFVPPPFALVRGLLWTSGYAFAVRFAGCPSSGSLILRLYPTLRFCHSVLLLAGVAAVCSGSLRGCSARFMLGRLLIRIPVCDCCRVGSSPFALLPLQALPLPQQLISCSDMLCVGDGDARFIL